MTPEFPPPPGTSPRRRLERADEPEAIRSGSAPGSVPGSVPGRPPARASSEPPPREPVVPDAPLEATIEEGVEGARIAPRAAPPPSGVVPNAALADLARAFRANADALREVNAAQGEIARSIRRADRAEAIVASTNALNDTFRGLTSIQREILERLDESKRRPSRLVPLLLLGLLVVFVGGIVAVVHLIDLSRAERTNPFEVADKVEAARDRGRAEGGAAKDRDLERAERAAADAEARLSEVQTRYEEKERALAEALVQKRGVEAEQQALADQLLGLRNESAARKALEDEMRSSAQKLAVLEPRVRELQADLNQEKAEKTRLIQRLAEAKAGLLPETPTPEEPAAAPPAVAPTAPAVSRDARQLEAIVTRINRFLEAAQGVEYWQIRKVEGVSRDRLHGVIAYRYDPHGKLLDGVDAKELVIWLDRNARKVDFEFRQGGRVFDNVKTPFNGGALTVPVAQGADIVNLWGNSGLLFLRSR